MSTTPESTTPVRKPYLPPTLTTYGQVSALTQAGTKGTAELIGLSPTRKSSDRRLKDTVARLGDHPLGFGLYTFAYKDEYKARCGEGRQFGVMADEVEVVMPDAVSLDADGFKQVDYSMLGIKTTVH